MSKLDYKKSGVNIEEAEMLVGHLQSTIRRDDSNIFGGIGDFAAMYRFGNSLLVAATDGVGTKLKLAFMTGKHDTIGIDLVAMNVNDVLTKGAKPLFFLDYFSTGELDAEIAKAVIHGIDTGCSKAGCSLIGGETAEMPDFYAPGEYDLAGFTVGAVDADKVIDGKAVKTGDAIVGFPSSGIHSNGYSLVRKLFFEELNMKVEDYLSDCEMSLGEVLLTPTEIYVTEILKVLSKYPGHIHGMAHITGGGFTNISRINPQTGFIIENLPDPPSVFEVIKSLGKIEPDEMYKTFNMGIGFVVITDIPDKIIEDTALSAQVIGHCDSGGAVEIIPAGIKYIAEPGK